MLAILQDEVTFVASLASLMPTMPGQLPSEEAAPHLDMLSKLMLVCSPCSQTAVLRDTPKFKVA